MTRRVFLVPGRPRKWVLLLMLCCRGQSHRLADRYARYPDAEFPPSGQPSPYRASWCLFPDLQCIGRDNTTWSLFLCRAGPGVARGDFWGGIKVLALVGDQTWGWLDCRCAQSQLDRQPEAETGWEIGQLRIRAAGFMRCGFREAAHSAGRQSPQSPQS